MQTYFRRLYEQGVDHQRLVQYVKNWIKWAKSDVSTDVGTLKLKTTNTN